MCGIAGFISVKPTTRFDMRSFLGRAAAILEHRGPDGWGYYLQQSLQVGLLHTRLAIIDPANGAQPMCHGDWIISFNGEIYNYRELRQELQESGVRFDGNSDTEVMLKAVSAWGESAFSRFNGEWACLLWNRKTRMLWASRDRYGIRPLYVLDFGGYLFFASETKAFDALPEYRRAIDTQGLAEHALLWNTLDDRTVFRDIRSVVPGTVERYSLQGNQSSHRYYRFPHEIDHRICLGEAVEQAASLLQSSVALRMRSDVPVGMYLSGGLDSTVIAGIVNKRLGHRPDSFSVAFRDPALDESRFQRQVAADNAGVHTEVMVDGNDVAGHISNASYHFERPVFRTAPVPLYLLSRKVNAGGYKVVLTGEGADEVLCGYDAFKETKLARFWARHQGAVDGGVLLKRLYPHLSHYRDDRNFGLMKIFYQRFLDPALRNNAGLHIRLHNNGALLSFLSADVQASAAPALIDRLLEPMQASSDWAQRQQYAEFRTLLAGYLLSSQGDRMTMAHSVEARFPFLDHRFVDFCFGLPSSFKLRGFNQKYLLKQAFRDLVPETIVKRPKMPYQAPDIASFVNDGQVHSLAFDMLAKDTVDKYGLFAAEKVRKLLQKAVSAGKSGKPLGYRDNMIFTFILTAQLSCYWAERKRMPMQERLTPQVELIEN